MFAKTIGPNSGPILKASLDLLPVGRSIVNCTGTLVLYFYRPGLDTPDVLVLPVGRHVVMCPRDASVRVDCSDDVQWSVEWPSSFNPFDPTRIEVALAKPISEREQMQMYLAEAAARAQSAELARQVRSGEVELDVADEDWDEESEDDMDSPLSVYQLQDLVNILQKDIERKRSEEVVDHDQVDIEEEAPPKPLKSGARRKPDKAAEAAASGPEDDPDRPD